MQFRFGLTAIASGLVALTALVCQATFAQVAQTATPDTPAHPRAAKSMPPRAAPTDYLTHAQAGALTIGAEFDGNSVPTPEATYTTEEYVTVEVGIYGPSGTRLVLSQDDFSLRLNGKKAGLSPKPYEMIFKSLKDPEWAPPVSDEPKSKGGLNAGGGGGENVGDTVTPVVHMPPELQRKMEQNVQDAAFPDGERLLPQAGLLHFGYSGAANKLRSIELVYSGRAGKTVITLK